MAKTNRTVVSFFITQLFFDSIISLDNNEYCQTDCLNCLCEHNISFKLTVKHLFRFSSNILSFKIVPLNEINKFI